MKNEFTSKELFLFGCFHLICFSYYVSQDNPFRSFLDICFVCNFFSLFALSFRIFLSDFQTNIRIYKKIRQFRILLSILIIFYFSVFISCVFFDEFIPFYPFIILLRIGVLLHLSYLIGVIAEFVIIKNEKERTLVDELHKN